MTKAIPLILREITAFEDENQDQISLYITQKTEFTACLHMLIDQIQLWVEKPVDIIRKALEEHKECMKSLDDVRMQ